MKAELIIELLLQALNSSGAVSQLIRQAHEQGRTINRDELDQAFAQDDEARKALQDAIDKA